MGWMAAHPDGFHDSRGARHTPLLLFAVPECLSASPKLNTGGSPCVRPRWYQHTPPHQRSHPAPRAPLCHTPHASTDSEGNKGSRIDGIVLVPFYRTGGCRSGRASGSDTKRPAETVMRYAEQYSGSLAVQRGSCHRNLLESPECAPSCRAPFIP